MANASSSAPAWRIVLSYFALFYGVDRAAMGYLAFRDGELSGFATVYLLQALSAVFVFVALRWQIRWIVPAVLGAGVLLGGTALVGWGLGSVPAVHAAVELLVAVISAAVLAALVRIGLKDDESRRRGPPP